MKTLASIFILCSGLINVAQAQEADLTFPVSAPCYETKEAERILTTDYGQIPFAEGESVVLNSKLDEFIEAQTIIYVNPETFSFTIAIEIVEDGMTCLTSSGVEFRPVDRKRGRIKL